MGPRCPQPGTLVVSLGQVRSSRAGSTSPFKHEESIKLNMYRSFARRCTFSISLWFPEQTYRLLSLQGSTVHGAISPAKVYIHDDPSDWFLPNPAHRPLDFPLRSCTVLFPRTILFFFSDIHYFVVLYRSTKAETGEQSFFLLCSGPRADRSRRHVRAFSKSSDGNVRKRQGGLSFLG